jgi:LPS sulfotransferase NodH
MIRGPITDATASQTEPPVGDGFVVLCDARSGSGYLCSCLDRHPEIACHHELFNPEYVGNCYGVESYGRSPESDPLAYLKAVRRHTQAAPGARLVGFKLHFRQHPKMLEHLLAHPGERIILLIRQDKLAQWASYQLANTTGQWVRPKNDTDIHPVQRVPFKLRRYTAYLIHQQAWEQLVLRRRPDCLYLCYEDILKPGTLARLLHWLGVDPQAELSPGSRPQFTGDSTLDRFSNPRQAAFVAPVAQILVRLIALSGVGPLIRRFTSY